LPQEVSVHEGKYRATSPGSEGEDSGYPKDAGDGEILTDQNGSYYCPYSDPGHKNSDDGGNALQDDDEPLETTFELNDTLYAKALVSAPDEVYLWLGVC
jgi:hypothetical protein